jgi:hypothetical protein
MRHDPRAHSHTQSTQPHSEHTATLRAHSHTRGHTHTSGTQPHFGDTHCRHPTPPTRPEQQKPHTTARTFRTNGWQDQPPQDTASPGTQPCQQTPLPPRGHSPAQGTHRLHTTPPRTESTVQILHTMIAPTAVTDRRRRVAPTAMFSSDAPGSSGDTALPRGTQPHSGVTATLQGTHTAGTQRPPPGLNSKNRTQLHARSEPTAGKTNRRRTQHPRGHCLAQGTHRLHTTPPGQKVLHKH